MVVLVAGECKREYSATTSMTPQGHDGGCLSNRLERALTMGSPVNDWGEKPWAASACFIEPAQPTCHQDRVYGCILLVEIGEELVDAIVKIAFVQFAGVMSVCCAVGQAVAGIGDGPGLDLERG